MSVITTYEATGDTWKSIPLSGGKVAIVDESDFERISQWKWYASKSGYAVRNSSRRDGPRHAIFMHRVLVDAVKSDGLEVDHINGNKLDNRKSNLRLATHAQNLRNQKTRRTTKTGFRGVDFRPNRGKYRARVAVDGKNMHIGTFSTAIEAHAAYSKVAVQVHGAFANTGG